ncbi:Ubiquinone biosynthesis hydroxylase, UbiH/UbiF/VisC/COQ6 family [Polaromonas sp. OV174]|uniref:FAD-dependent monooxygenase n=1 Tax=Polaromonas sp. OV174 TaxID=1855300 RepID=UPI0008EDEC67|nr:FAD-dependent monooxygenase [Polaromonas sp. OV174]SFC02365.1 Ubiquinone biosynthesis hydroxylase, UbiH/UbiF/VisC/COQ6 family [Polaromonas sp. OV174]
MSKSFDVCIRGDGVVGRSLALLLARERLRVALVTRPDSASADQPGQARTDVRAYALNSASRQVLESLRVWPEAPFATPVREMRVWGDDGGRLDFSADSVAQEALAWIVDVPALEQQLIQAVRYQPQIETVQAPVKAALTVICEGRQSRSRDEFGAHWTVKPYPQKAIAARLEADAPHGGVARQWFSGGDILALLPLSGAAGNSVALVWSVSVERAAALEKLAPEEFCAALQAVCGEEVGSLRLTSERASWPLALSRADHWVGPGWALAGDAAHTVHPLSGQGLNLGLADAACLASVLAQREYWRELGDEKLLRRYERARQADVSAMGAVTDGLHGLFAQPDGRWQALRNWGMKGFARSALLKRWVARQAAGL